MELDKNVVGWFEIPVKDMDRAKKFYETVFGFELSLNKMGVLDMAWFPGKENATGSMGSLVYHEEFYKPSLDGVLVYFTAFSGDLTNELARVKEAGGTVLVEKKLIKEDIGYIGVFLDSEGNRIGIHSRT